MQCPNCQALIAEGMKFCSACGAGISSACPRCQTRVRPTDKFCHECGQQLNQSAQKTPSSTKIDGERKHVTVLFSDLSGYTAMADRLDPEEVRDLSSHLFAEIAKIIATYRGFIEKFVGDAVLAIFGLPAVHEDDPVRAVKAALEIHRLVHTISPGLENRIDEQLYMHSGIHTGLVVTGQMIVEEGIHGVVGDTLNLASRLADSANADEIRVSTATYDLIAPYFDTEPLRPVKLKGIAKPVNPHRILGPRDVNTRFEAAKRHGFTDFTGRRKELARLHTGLEKAMTGRGQLVTVSGEAGAGKSRLAYEFRHRIDRNQIVVLEGRCQSFGSNTPYLPFLNALRRGLSLNTDAPHRQLEEKAIANILAIDASLDQYLPLYLHLLSIPSRTYPLSHHLRGQKLKNAITQALAKIILLNSVRKPMVLLLEDWHWVDEASDSILAHLTDRLASYPLMVVVLYRPDRAYHWPDRPFHRPCALKAMDYRHTARIIQAIWKVDALPHGFATFIHDHTGGNPFFIEEVCKALTEEGSVRISDCQPILVHPLETLKLPAGVQSVIRARMDRLDPYAKQALQLAAVIGREFGLRLLEQISDRMDRLCPALDRLAEQELIQQTRPMPDAEYVFKHVLTQFTVYESLLLKQRKAYHASVGQALERLFDGRLEAQCENLAHHYSNSTQTQKAIVYLEMAGTKASRVHSLAEARKYYETAITILDADSLDAQTQHKYIDLTLRWAQVSQFSPSNKIMQALARSLAHAKTLDKRDRIAEVSYWTGRFGYMQGDFVDAIRQIKKCIRWAAERDDRELLAVSYTLFGRACLYTGDFELGVKQLSAGIERIQRYNQLDEEVYSTAILGLLSGLTGHFKTALHTIAKAIKIARKNEIPTFEAMAFGYLGSIHFWFGHFHASINNCRQCIDISKKLDNPLPIIWATFFEGAARFNAGDRDDGLATMARSIDMLTNMDSVLALRFFYAHFAESLALHGNYHEAESINRKAMALDHSGQRWGEIASQRTMALLAAAAAQPDWQRITGHMQTGIDIATRAGAKTELVLCWSHFADLMQKKGDRSAARAYYRQARALADRIGCTAPTPQGVDSKKDNNLE